MHCPRNELTEPNTFDILLILSLNFVGQILGKENTQKKTASCVALYFTDSDKRKEAAASLRATTTMPIPSRGKHGIFVVGTFPENINVFHSCIGSLS